MIVVVKVGTSSITTDGGRLNAAAMTKLMTEIATVRAQGHQVVLVSSAAIAAGMAHLELAERPKEFSKLQALSAVGQIQLMKAYDSLAHDAGMRIGQVLVAPPDFFDRGRYLRARSCIEEQLALGVLPVVNENDAVADDAIRFGDNDRIASLVAHLIRADLLVLLTDTEGVLTADPREDESASLIEEIATIDKELEALAGGSATTMSQGGMASKLSAAKIASWSGVESVIAAAHRENVLVDAINAEVRVGTRIRAREAQMTARKLWIAFALGNAGVVTVDDGARQALIRGGSSLLPIGISAVSGAFVAGDAVEIAGTDGVTFAKGLTQMAAAEVSDAAGKHSDEIEAVTKITVHRDDLVLLPS